jgi:peptide deformylase
VGQDRLQDLPGSLSGDLFVDKISTADRTMNQSKLRKMAKETQAKLKKK